MSTLEWFLLGVLASIFIGFVFNFFNKRRAEKAEEEANEEISDVKEEIEKAKDDIENIKKGKG